MPWHDGRMSMRYVVLGDSHAEGVGDEANPDGSARGWSDRLAQFLAADGTEVLYANLAVRGLRVDQVRDTQLATALMLRPDLAIVSAGANDILRPDFSPESYSASLIDIVRPLREAGARVLLMPAPPIGSLMPLGRLSRTIDARIAQMNAALEGTAQATGAELSIEVTDEIAETFLDLRLWSPDRLHLNAAGHDRLARDVAAALGVQGTADPDTGADVEVVPTRVPNAGRSVRRDAIWWSGTAGPWLLRRLRRRSSADGRVAKRPDLVAVDGVGGGAHAR